MHCFRFDALITPVLLLSLSGCSSEVQRPTCYPVSGVVTLKGKPLEGATVTFVPQDTKLTPAAGITNAEGKYQLTSFESNDGAQAGVYGVKVAKYDLKRKATAEEVQNLSYEDEQKRYSEDLKPTPPAKNTLPAKYENEVKSGLTHTVPQSPSTFDIKID